MLVINNIEVKYKGIILVLKGISLNVGEGALISVLGNNGAGKTTLLKSISGLLRTEEGEVTDGTIEYEGKRIDHASSVSLVRMGIVPVMEGRRIFGHLSAEENILVGANPFNDSRIKKDLELVYGYFPRIKALRKKTCGYLSGGEQQMAVIGRALMARPRLMLMDEPSLGLSPILQDTIIEVVSKINAEQKVAVLLVEQNALAALNISEYGYVLENGRVVLDGTKESLLANEDIKEFYLGLSKVGQRKSYRDIKHYKRRKRWLG